MHLCRCSYRTYRSVFPYLIVAVGTYYTDCVPFESKIQHFSRTYIIIIRVYAEVLRINVNKLALDVFRSGIRHTTFRCLTVHGHCIDHLQFLFNRVRIVLPTTVFHVTRTIKKYSPLVSRRISTYGYV